MGVRGKKEESQVSCGFFSCAAGPMMVLFTELKKPKRGSRIEQPGAQVKGWSLEIGSGQHVGGF